jgi:hypothetical protein
MTYSDCFTNEQLHHALAKAVAERDEARKDLDEEMKFHHRTHGECVMAQCELMDVKNERDEAREDAERYRRKTLSQDAEISKLKANSNENYLCKETLDQE